jgi:hypothetical protein
LKYNKSNNICISPQKKCCKHIFYHRHPIIKWAQRKDRVFIEVGLRDIVDEKIDLTETTISFQGTSDKVKYAFDF